MTPPAEWAPHGAVFVGFPSHPDLWEAHLEPAQGEVAQFCRALAGPGREIVRLLAANPEAVAAARALLAGVAGVAIEEAEFGDIWLRDTGPVFTAPDTAAGFAFNGWGGKYVLAGDETVAATIARLAGARLDGHPFVLEGGAIDHDGEGTFLATRQCLLNPNRNRGWKAADAEAALAAALGAKRVIWLGDGLMNDHTDGHVDNLARFVAPGVAACPIAYGSDDPNHHVYDRAAEALAAAALRVLRVPSPGRVIDEHHRSLAASHLNFLIANGAVIVPAYESFASRLACEALKTIFADREVIPLPARALLTGGGAFHCISQQQPA